MRPSALDHLVLRVADVDRSLGWYVAVLGLAPERVDEWRRGEAPFPSVRVSDQAVIDLIAADADHTAPNVDHFCLAVEDVDLHEVVESGRFDVIEGPVPRWGARGTATAVYVRDPDGNIVELRVYP